LSGPGTSFGDNCPGAAASRDLCLQVAEAARVLGARSVIVLAAGNPVPGTASTLGMRTPSHPRLSVAARVTAAPVALPPLGASSAAELDFTPIAIALDAGIGVFSGLTLAPTIGGFASLDLLGSLAYTSLPSDDALSGSLTAWAAGVRLGLLRESFTAPGASVSLMYRRLGDLGFGASDLTAQDAWFRLRDMDGWSARVAVSKRLLGLGLTAGAGRDSYRAEATGSVRDATVPGGRLGLADDELEINRNTLFANAALTLLILHAVAELGWQGGGKEEAGMPTTGKLEKAGLYGSLALRLSL
jgi:hypothetical protein